MNTLKTYIPNISHNGQTSIRVELSDPNMLGSKKYKKKKSKKVLKKKSKRNKSKRNKSKRNKSKRSPL